MYCQVPLELLAVCQTSAACPKQLSTKSTSQEEKGKKAHTLVSLDAEGKSGQEKKKGRKSRAG